jgi:LysR family transcriptional activator of nhaA
MAARPLNLKHLRYFAEVARGGSVSLAARRLFVAPQTVSAQVKELEDSVGQPLFERAGKKLLLTSAGEIALDYANAIFALGDELGAVLRRGASPKRQSLRVGITDSVPKLLTVTTLQPLVQRHRKRLDLSCSEGSFGELLGRVAAGELDLVLADSAVPPNLARTLQGRVCTESGVSFRAVPALQATLHKNFPASLNAAPYLAGAGPASLIAQAIEAWFAKHDVRPHIAGRIEDSALLKGFAQAGLGFIAVPQSIETEVTRQFGLRVIGRAAEVRHAVYLISPRARRAHPLVAELEKDAAHRSAR